MTYRGRWHVRQRRGNLSIMKENHNQVIINLNQEKLLFTPHILLFVVAIIANAVETISTLICRLNVTIHDGESNRQATKDCNRYDMLKKDNV